VKATAQDAQFEDSLVAKARGGSSEAFSELIHLHSPMIYRVSMKMLKNHADAEDNLQNVFCRVHAHIHRFGGRSRFSTWLVRITINEALMKIRRQRCERLVFQSDMPRPKGEHAPVLEIEDVRPDPESQYITKELAAKAFHGLSSAFRDTFILCKAEGWTHRELAGAMGTSVQTIKSRIFRARARLQLQLQPVCGYQRMNRME
jgi:RNA polymerase sigma-70 factor, ECF subfamily